MEIVDFQMEVLPSCLSHICQREYVAMNGTDLAGGELKICRDCIDVIPGRGESEILKKVVDSTVYGTDESGGNEEEME